MPGHAASHRAIDTISALNQQFNIPLIERPPARTLTDWLQAKDVGEQICLGYAIFARIVASRYSIKKGRSPIVGPYKRLYRWCVPRMEMHPNFPSLPGRDAASEPSEFGAHRHLVVHEIGWLKVKLLA
jgi:hypothetical protein